MSKTRRMIGLGVLVTLTVLGSGWALERAASHSHGPGSSFLSPAKTGDTPATPAASSERPAADLGPEYDRSDLLLSQG